MEANESLNYLPIISFFLVFVGWYVLFNSAKHISTRSEAKGIINDLVTLLKDQNKISVEYWSNYSPDKKQENQLYQKKTSFFLSLLRHYNDILKRYNVDVLDDDGILSIKNTLTETPYIEIRGDSDLLNSFCKKKVVETTGLVQKNIGKLHREYCDVYTPVPKPFLYQLKNVLGDILKLTVIGLILVFAV